MTDVLTSRDGLIGNSPRYTNSISPPYQRYLKDDSGAAINLTGVSPSALSIVFVNQSNPLTVKAGAGTFSIPSGTASQGFAEYQYATADLAVTGNWYAFWTVQLPGELSPRAFDPDFLEIKASPTTGGTPSVTVQDVNLTEVNGTAVSSSNPVPTSGPITAADGGIATLGTTTDTSSANTTIGLLKAIKAYLGGTLTASVNSLPALPTGTNTIGGVKLIDSAGTNVAGVDSSNNQLVKVNAALPAGSNVIGHVVVDSAGSVSVTSLPSIPAGTNVIGHVIVDSGTVTANAGTGNFTIAQATASNLNAQVVGNIASGSADSGNPLKIGGVYNSSAPTLTNDQRGDIQLDANANLKETLATLIAGEDLTANKLVVEQRYSYLNITATGTTVVKSGSGYIKDIVVNNPCELTSATTTTSIAIYDNTAASGTKIGTPKLPVSANLAGALPFSIPVFDTFNTGLTIVITLGTSGVWTPDITVNYR